MRLIRGKYDSRYRFRYDDNGRNTGILDRGYFMSAMNYARYTQGGVKMIEHVRNKPWDTWRGFYNFY